ncbi:MAG: CDP-archaeol synthase [Opitutaceae bacterium]
MSSPLATALWIVGPVALAGLTQVAVIKLGLFRALAARPLDCGVVFRGQRLFGENKTFRGLVVMIVATAGWVAIFEGLAAWCHWPAGLSAPFQQAHPLLWGALAGAGYVAGELPNSFIKRQLGIAAGAAAAGAARLFFWIIDQVDSVAGVLLFLYPVWHPSGAVVACLFGVTLLIHPLVALVMFCLGLKNRIG